MWLLPALRAMASGSPCGDDAAAARAALGPQVDDPVRFGHDVEIVLDHHHRIAGVDQPLQHRESFSTSAMCRPTVGSSSTYSVCCPSRRAMSRPSASVRTLASSVTSLIRWLSPPDSVGLGWPETQVSEAHVRQQLTGWCTLRWAAKNSSASSTLIARISPMLLPLNKMLKVSRIEASPAAHVAEHLHVRQEAHLDALHALALAGLAAAAGRVE